MPEALLLDTCAALWLMNKARMSPASLDRIRAAQRDGSGVHVSPISAWEVATLVAKGRISLAYEPEVWFESLLALPGIRLADMSPAVLMRSAFLPGEPPNDPADRILAATAREHEQALVTRDGALLRYGEAGHLTVVAC
ncbi:MAG: type II toxin-antitoxin system VapC family toxin [Alphaproteobacteria bacterium]|jgi:PIN domain nuclease of toxin-antitoxin system|nr:type II toxin-antitoxin system VapC family toxin [Alphaproteobacteria bacterium]